MEEAVNFSVRDEDDDELRVRFLGGRIMVSVGGEFGILWPTPAQARQIATALIKLAAEVDGERWEMTRVFGAEDAIPPPSEVARLREALVEARAWHEAERKGLSKQPPNAGDRWQMLRHREQIDLINRALSDAKEGGDE